MRGRLLTACAIAVACAAPAAAAELAALFDAAGVARHLDEWPEANALARERAQVSLDPDAFALLMREVAAALAAPALLERVTAHLSAGVAADRIAPLRAGYAQTGSEGLLGPPGGFTASDLRDFPAFTSGVARRQLEPARLELVARIDGATGFGHNAWRVTGAWGGAIERGARALRCEGSAAWETPLAPEVIAERRQLAEPFRGRVHLELAFLARTRTLAELRRSADFLDTPPPRAFHASLEQVVDVALAEALASLRARLAAPAAQRCADRGPAR